MILSIDPGSEKTGVAVVKKDGNLVFKKIIKTEELELELQKIFEFYNLETIVTGNGTHHKEIKKRLENKLEELSKNISVKVVNEKYTTEIGEQWYKKYNPPKGWKKFIPSGFRTIEEPVDDYVAWVIACIYLGIIKEENVGHKKV